MKPAIRRQARTIRFQGRSGVVLHCAGSWERPITGMCLAATGIENDATALDAREVGIQSLRPDIAFALPVGRST
jgi:hypothetical protein